MVTNILLGGICFFLSQLFGYMLNEDATNIISKSPSGMEITALVFMRKIGFGMMWPTYAVLGLLGLVFGKKEYKK